MLEGHRLADDPIDFAISLRLVDTGALKSKPGFVGFPAELEVAVWLARQFLVVTVHGFDYYLFLNGRQPSQLYFSDVLVQEPYLLYALELWH